MALSDDAVTEVRDLHEFFQSWFRGEADCEAFDHPTESLAGDFRMVSPDGTESARETVLDGIESARNSETESDPPFVIEIRNPTVRHETDGHCQVRYEEWQRRGENWNARLSTALFRRDDDAPNGVVWVDLHETWLDESGESENSEKSRE